MEIKWKIENVGISQTAQVFTSTTKNNDNSYVYTSSYAPALTELIDIENGLVECTVFANGRNVTSLYVLLRVVSDGMYSSSKYSLNISIYDYVNVPPMRIFRLLDYQ